ncbi:YraN family protein [Chitinimonas sp. BJB300]|uniref:YraN family protein n=1 Tax=Chitinimonas sp. BJB300 TaxID=1559339 RepID=UPI000C0D0690|nr:YraN family protein [Chitinimonas sp. BJB300]PHV11660.1 YraN family protein [Chitinimonas sp. BJB300]TSJ85913.1 YraN family protein [Chitinimonas sp. BJB300]
MSQTKGAAAETLAAAYLVQRGLSIVVRNWRCRMGELDLIANDAGTLVFVEVRSRAVGRFGDAAASITASKQAKLVAAAQQYLATLSRTPPCRFDAVLLDGTAEPRWLKNIIEI